MGKLRISIPVPRFLSAGEVFASAGSLGVLRALNAAKAAVLLSGSIARNDEIMAHIRKSVGALAVAYFVVPAGEPRLENLSELQREVNAFRPDWLVAIGGGSVIDSAKLIWIHYEHPDLELERLVRPFGIPPLRGKASLVAVPTTSGTGTEVSSSALFLSHGTSEKQVAVSHDLLPDVVILDPKLTIGVPKKVMAYCGMDALAHALEGYISRNDNILVDQQAESVVRTLFSSLEGAREQPTNLELRLTIMSAALTAGWVQNLKLPGIGHAIAHQLADVGVPHGLAVGRLLVPSLQFNLNSEKVNRKIEALLSRWDGGTPASLLERLEGLATRLGIYDDFQTFAPRLSQNDICKRIVTGAQRDICFKANPRDAQVSDLEGLLAEVS
ncbi:MAG: iron-containing alcohol dehydrogenase [Myxococcota bacterium]|nr:iron-containing alcohol dehydrogenase [Myxococcota bacterium]